MVKVTPEQTTFAAGEVSPQLEARQNLARVQSAVRTAQNVIVTPEGNLTAAPGTRMISPVYNDAARALIIPMAGRDGADALTIVINGGLLRFYKPSGAVLRPGAGPQPPYDLTTPGEWTEASYDNMRWAQSGDVLFVVGAGRPRQINRFADTSITITDYDHRNGPTKDRNLDATLRISASAVTGPGVTLTAIGGELFKAGHVGSVWRIDEADFSTPPQWVGGETLTAGQRRRNRGNVYEALNANGSGVNPPTHTEGDVSAGSGANTWRFIDNGRGYVRITAVASPTSATCTVLQRLPASVAAGGSTRWYEAAWSDVEGWPNRVLIFDGRIVMARGDRLWFTKSGDFYDYDATGLDDSAIPLRLTPPQAGAATTVVDVEWMLGSGILVVGTPSGEHIIRGSAAADQITISTIRALSDTNNGSLRHRPVMAERGAVFIGPDGKRVYYADFERLTETVDATDLTIFARHILKAGAVEIVYQREPSRILWLRMADGSLRALTFNLKQDIVGWSRRSFVNGVCESMGVTAGPGGRIDVWMIMRRTIGGQTRRFIELMQPQFEAIEDDPEAQTSAGGWFVDSGLELVSAQPVTQLSGLLHLAGETVRIVCDGGDRGTAQVAADGTLTLTRPARNVIVGLPVPLRVKGLPMDVAAGPTLSKGLRKRASKVAVQLTATQVAEISVNGGPSEPLVTTGARDLGGPVELFHGVVLAGVVAPSARQIIWEISREEATPFTLLGVTGHVDMMEMP
jgi:hypothetical protein